MRASTSGASPGAGRRRPGCRRKCICRQLPVRVLPDRVNDRVVTVRPAISFFSCSTVVSISRTSAPSIGLPRQRIDHPSVNRRFPGFSGGGSGNGMARRTRLRQQQDEADHSGVHTAVPEGNDITRPQTVMVERNARGIAVSCVCWLYRHRRLARTQPCRRAPP